MHYIDYNNKFNVTQLDHDVEGYTRCAYTYGPILLAVVGKANHENGIVLKGKPQELISKLRKTDYPLYFEIEGEDNYYVAHTLKFRISSLAVTQCLKVYTRAKKNMTHGEKAFRQDHG